MCHLGFFSVLLTQQHCLSLMQIPVSLLPIHTPCYSADPSYSCPQEKTDVLGERKKKSFKFGGIREDLPGIGDCIISNKLHAASSCVMAAESMADTEGGSLNPDLRIREKGVLGKRTLPKGRPSKLCPMFLKSLKSTTGLKNNQFPKHPRNICTNVGINKVHSPKQLSNTIDARLKTVTTRVLERQGMRV